jgi:hypothetical protein
MTKMRLLFGEQRLLYSYHALLFLVIVLLLQHPKVSTTAKLLHDLDFVVPLTDETFEHETQASTGQTTGTCEVWSKQTTVR